MSNLSDSEKKRLFSLFDNVKQEDRVGGLNRSSESEILIVDFMNTFIRAFMASPSLNSNGNHTGGIAGCLKSIGYAAKLINPTKIVVVSDGQGGSLKRRKIYPQYKSGRKTKIRLNRAYDDLTTPDTEDKNLKKQLLRTVQYLDKLPVTTMAIDHIEADDTIAYLATEYFKNSNVTIMSADKDFLQLAGDRVKIWSPSKLLVEDCMQNNFPNSMIWLNEVFGKINSMVL